MISVEDAARTHREIYFFSLHTIPMMHFLTPNNDKGNWIDRFRMAFSPPGKEVNNASLPCSTPNCKHNSVDYCSGCALLCCEVCVRRHGRELCKIVKMATLKRAFSLLCTTYATGADDLKTYLTGFQRGDPVRSIIRCSTQADFDKIMENEVDKLGPWTIGIDGMVQRKPKYLLKPVLSSQSIAMAAASSPQHQKINQAQHFMLVWAFTFAKTSPATTHAHSLERHEVYEDIKAFISGRPRIKAKADAKGLSLLPRGAPRQLSMHEERNVSDLIDGFADFSRTNCRYELANVYDSYAQVGGSGAITYNKWITPKKCKLVWCDPMYDLSSQPNSDQQQKLRLLFDAVSAPGTVIIVWGKPNVLYKVWEPMFKDKLYDSECRYVVDNNLIAVERPKLRDKFTHNKKSFHNVLDCAIAVTVIETAESKHLSKKKAVLLDTRNFNQSFRDKWGENGIPTNKITMKPPATRMRCTDENGKPVRKNAEKSLELNEWFLDLLTLPGDWVIDLFAGTGSMGMGCIKLNRIYQGCEIDYKIHYAGQLRLARFYIAFIRGDLQSYIKANKPGAIPSILVQVIFFFFFPPSLNRGH